MVCPYCLADSVVTNSRLQKRTNGVWRRRKCPACGVVWTSLERSEPGSVWRFGSDGKLHVFRPQKLLISLYEACRHRRTADVDAAYIADTVLQKLIAKKQAVIERELVTKISYDVLRHYDKTAAAVYKAQHPAAASSAGSTL